MIESAVETWDYEFDYCGISKSWVDFEEFSVDYRVDLVLVAGGDKVHEIFVFFSFY